jgi:Holliday junction resolvasome RuvABC endonuclease subunit
MQIRDRASPARAIFLEGATRCTHVTNPHPVLGIDASASKIGFAVAWDGYIKTWLYKPKGTGVVRIDEHYRNIKEVVDLYDIRTAAIEGYSFGSRASQAHTTGECGGAVKLGLRHKGVQLILVSPNTLKMYVTSKGNSPKNAIPLGLYKLWGLDITQEDEADAAGIAMLGAAYYHADAFTLLKYQQKAMKGVNPVND